MMEQTDVFIEQVKAAKTAVELTTITKAYHGFLDTLWADNRMIAQETMRPVLKGLMQQTVGTLDAVTDLYLSRQSIHVAV